ncbi:MAG: ribonuclease III [Akkermansia sp.]|nr:ribonuclease III [Akkermansia sp.]
MQREVLEKSLGYVFTDEVWLKQALTHPSVDQKKSTNLAYERLEFLGDAVLELVVSRELFTLYPKADEGVLTKMRAGIVSRQNLARLCVELGWMEQLDMSPQLEHAGGRSTLSVQANTFESVIGAVMMDSNYNAARKVSLQLLRDSLDKAESFVQVNSKGALLEALQAVDGCGPVYRVELVDAAKPAGPFRAYAYWHELEVGVGEGPSKHKAEMAAAADALQKKLWTEKK